MYARAPSQRSCILSEFDVTDVPVTLITGPLGVGKTTAVLSAFERFQGDERWAVIVNEFGQVGIDGPTFDAAGVQVREVRGGCICCTSGLGLRVALVHLLRDVEPDRILIEPTGLAHPATILDMLRLPGLREATSPRAVVALVDPRRLPEDLDLLAPADVVVANFSDLATPAQLEAFEAFAARLEPPRAVVATTAHGVLERAWIDLQPSPERTGSAPVHDVGAHAVASGWVFPPSQCFDRARLEDALQELVQPSAALPEGVLRLKGIFRTPRVWLGVQATTDTIRYRPSGWRRDSRVEVIARKHPEVDFEEVERRLRAALLTGSG